MFAGNIVTSSESREQVEKRSGGMLWRIGEWKSAETRYNTCVRQREGERYSPAATKKEEDRKD